MMQDLYGLRDMTFSVETPNKPVLRFQIKVTN